MVNVNNVTGEGLFRANDDLIGGRVDADDRRLAQSLELIASLFQEQASLKPDTGTCPTLTAAQAISLTLDRMSEATLPDDGGEPAVELLGYLLEMVVPYVFGAIVLGIFFGWLLRFG